MHKIKPTFIWQSVSASRAFSATTDVFVFLTAIWSYARARNFTERYIRASHNTSKKLTKEDWIRCVASRIMFMFMGLCARTPMSSVQEWEEGASFPVRKIHAIWLRMWGQNSGNDAHFLVHSGKPWCTVYEWYAFHKFPLDLIFRDKF